MPKVKQVSSKRPRSGQIGFEPPKRAIKTTIHTNHPGSSPRRLPTIPNKIRSILTARRIPGLQPARKSVQPARREALLRNSKFLAYSIPKLSFQRLCRDIAHTHMPECRFTIEALSALQAALEDFMVSFFEDAAMCMKHAKRVTLFQKDMELVAKLRKFEYEPL